MTAAEWVSFAVQLLTLAAALALPLWALIEIRGRRVFVTREEWEMHERNQAERIAEVVVRPLEKIAERMDAIAHAQTRQEEVNRSIGRSLDDIREQVRELRDAG